MKIFRRHLLALALAFCLLSALSAVAQAENKSSTKSATVGQPFTYTETFTETVAKMETVNPNADLMFTAFDNGFAITGTPTYAGTFLLRNTVTYTSGEQDVYDITIQILNADGSGPATPTPPPTPAFGGKVTITKHPTGETVAPGGSAKFIARAENATNIVWRLVSPDTTNTYTAQEAPAYFAGLYVEGLGSDTLTLHGIPYSLNNWCVEAKFEGEGGPVFSNGARITVVSPEPTTPRITAQPKSAQLQNGETCTLSVTATTNNGALRYQWYESRDNQNTGGSAVIGATGASFTPQQIAGTCYYYVNVWSSLDGRESTHVNSAVASVQYPSAPANTQPANNGAAGSANTSANTNANTPATPGTNTNTGTSTDASTNNGTPATPLTESGTNTVTGTEANPNGSSRSEPGEEAVVVTTAPSKTPSSQRSHTGLILLIMVLAAVLLAACVTLFFLKRSRGDE